MREAEGVGEPDALEVDAAVGLPLLVGELCWVGVTDGVRVFVRV